MPEKYTLITGASSGIGEGFARALAAEGTQLILVARRVERLEKLRDELGKWVKVQIIQMDLSRPESAVEIFEICQREGWQVGGLVNNAGLGFSKDLANLSADEMHRMLMVNVYSLTALTRLFVPGMIERGNGYVLNVASVAGFVPIAHFSLYAATKNFVVSLSEALAMELRDKGIRVCALCPGPVATEFFDHARMKPAKVPPIDTVENVVNCGMKALRKGRVIAFPALSQRLVMGLLGFVPWVIRRWIVVLSYENILKKTNY